MTGSDPFRPGQGYKNINKIKIKQYLNRGISTPVAIFIILVFLLIVGAAILWEVKFGCEGWFKSTPLPSATPTPTPSQPYIKIIYPNRGEEWEIGKIYTIRWKSIGIDWVNIELRDAISLNSYYLNKKPIPAELGSYTFEIEKFISMSGATGRISPEPLDLVSSDKYVAVVHKPYEPDNNIEDASDNYFTIACWDKDNCAKEGEQICNWITCKFCCPGLISPPIKEPWKNEQNEVICVPLMVSNFCIKCGDGVCAKAENWCICPQDCEKPNPQDLILY